MAQCQGPRAQIVRLFLAFTHIWQEGFAEISEVSGALSNVNPASFGQ